MDIPAILEAENRDLQKIGLSMGDTILLKAFAVKEQTDSELEPSSRKEDLAQSLKSSTADRIGSKFGKRKGVFSVSLSWSHFSAGAKRFVPVRASTGGGVQKFRMKESDNYDALHQVAIDHFFKNGKSVKGELREMNTHVGLPNSTEDTLNLPTFTIGHYVSENKIKNVRFCLYSKVKSSQQVIMESVLEDTSNSSVEPALTPSFNPALVLDSFLFDFDHSNTNVFHSDEPQGQNRSEVSVNPVQDGSYVQFTNGQEEDVSGNLFQTEQIDVTPVRSVELTNASEGSPNPAELRRARLRHYRQPPQRFRHSIGSPSLSMAISHQVAEASFGDDEVERFFNNLPDTSLITNGDDVDIVTDNQLTQFIEFAKMRFTAAEKNDSPRHIIVQREESRFWTIMLRQSKGFDASKNNLYIRFGGEAGVDAGGLMREFLTLAMARFSQIPGICSGHPDSIHFKMVPENFKQKVYFMLGQVTGLAILLIGRGPECLSSLVVRAIYDQEYPIQLPDIQDLELQEKVRSIMDGDHDLLVDVGINPSCNSNEENIRLFTINWVILNNYAAIAQFSLGLKTIDPSFTEKENYSIMKNFLLPNKKGITLEEMMKWMEFNTENLEVGSNKYVQHMNLFCDFELFLASVANGDVDGISLEDIFYLFTGLKRIPPFGLGKKVDVSFEDQELPKISTCGLYVVLPSRDIEKALKIAVHFGAGFGDV